MVSKKFLAVFKGVLKGVILSGHLNNLIAFHLKYYLGS